MDSISSRYGASKNNVYRKLLREKLILLKEKTNIQTGYYGIESNTKQSECILRITKYKSFTKQDKYVKTTMFQKKKLLV